MGPTPKGTLSYTYDAAGNVASITSSNTNGISVNYTYDQTNRLLTVADNRLTSGQYTTTYTYDLASNLATVTYPNGVSSTFTYDDLNRVTAVNDGIYRLSNETISLDPHSKNGTVGYSLDPVGNRLSQTSTLPGISTGSFTYDANDRL